MPYTTGTLGDRLLAWRKDSLGLTGSLDDLGASIGTIPGSVTLPPSSAPAFGAVQGTTTATTALTAVLPTHSEGDMLILFVGYDSGTSAGISAPALAGWTEQAHRRTGSATFYTGGSLWTKIAGASESNPSITLNGTPASAAQAVAVAIENVTTVDQALDIIYPNDNGLAALDTPILSNAQDAIVLEFFVNRRNNDTITGTTNEYTYSTSTTATTWFGWREVATADAAGATSVSFSETSFRPYTASISVSP